ncbi:MAG: hypothetical protein P4M11_15460 [Candidatus Pacebacteria bacterium]|nr:hypothetical protein [Candidatus Paceibacterota bacterium]
MCTQSLTSVTIRNWFIAAIGNAIITLYCIAIYIVLFYSVTTPSITPSVTPN